eukprot:TRINITY_DN15353_c0_g1_i1.p1 TRINITY_DN15353_c0_g1~~TRINITY_DN15353_c0_g1_i1.p1  ORF type:complete len:299 (+),score=76.86 TRINITY_DN15353_c0_g1_i1:131-898(+)
MTYMCLEFCNETTETINNNIKQIAQLSNLLDAVAYEHYQLGPNSTLTTGNLTNVLPMLKETNIKEIWAMIDSYPYPPQFLDYMRQLFKNPKPFITSVIQEGIANGYTGFNVDWEPTATANEQDAKNYAIFLNQLATELKTYNLGVIVDVATWNSIWNYTYLSEATEVDRFITMGTYTGDNKSFLQQFNDAKDAFGNKAGIGLQTINPDNNQNYTDPQLDYRFDLINQNDIQEIDIWSQPIPNYWYSYLENYKNGN